MTRDIKCIHHSTFEPEGPQGESFTLIIGDTFIEDVSREELEALRNLIDKVEIYSERVIKQDTEEGESHE